MELENIFVLKNIEKKFGNRKILNDISLEIPKNKVTCILGPSGTGKTTLLKCLNLLEEIDGGEIYFENELIYNSKDFFVDPKSLRQKVGLVFQKNNLWPNRNILNNLTLGLIIVKKIKRKTAEKKALDLLKRFGLSEYVKKYPKNLSGGELQRVSICKSLLMNPEVMLLDEITSSLDVEIIETVFNFLMELKKTGITLIIVTHHVEFAKKISDKIIFMDDGKIVEEGRKDVLSDPKSPRLKEFIKSMGRLK